MKQKVLITGGAGFIGSHTADLLIQKGYDVYIYDNLNAKTHNGFWPEYMNKKAKLILGDINDRNQLLKAISKVNYIIHLAAEMDLNPDFKTFMDVNAGGTALIYELIVKNNLKIKKIIVASTQFVYGDGQWNCQTHGRFDAKIRTIELLKHSQWNICCPQCGKEAEYCKNIETFQNPPNHYALSKYFQEKIALTLGKLYNIPSVVLRYSIVHGSRQSLKNTYSGALRTFTINLFLKRTLATFEDNNSIRDFISVFDIANANLIALESKKADFDIFNVGGDKAWAISDIAKILAFKMGQNLKFSKISEFRLGDIRHALSDNSKMKNLGWRPIYSEEETITEYLNWFKTQKFNVNNFLNTQKLLRKNKVIQKSNYKINVNN
jgi:dTDP-L-rhamnose 4-epimerase